MKNRFFFVLYFIQFAAFAQITINGIVTEKNGPLEGAAVYFNNTMLGTTTNNEGKFSLEVKEGQYELVVSYLGYKKIVYSLNTSSKNKLLVFKLEEEENTLDEVVITKTVYDDEWKYNLDTFKSEFIGKTEIAKDCEILNPEVLHFNFDAKNNVLIAIARRPLE
ncbi:MAG: carboxypeptidase-like regulatory domain-containing protein, partial [Polaribacter sp.]|nr:carboxypeptidase-like regulatory domain-containing protein [Polaribacter sp.]